MNHTAPIVESSLVDTKNSELSVGHALHNTFKEKNKEATRQRTKANPHSCQSPIPSR
jgi:hypothetical protein